MTRQIPEADWTVFRKLHEVAVDRYCDTLLADAAQIISDSDKSSHDRYGELYSLMGKRTKIMAQAFDDFRRSTAFVHIAIIRGHGLWTEKEFAEFSDETQQIARMFAGL